MLDMKLKENGNEGELKLIGRIDSSTAPEAEKIILQVAEKYDKLVLNFENLEYISSAGLRIMKKGHMAMKKKGGVFALTKVNSMVMEVFEMTGFAGFLKFI